MTPSEQSVIPAAERRAWGERGHPGRQHRTVADDVMAELRRAQVKFGPIASTHEGYAVIQEEVDEFWEGVKTKGTEPAALRAELIQIAAMAMRTILDCLDTRS